jgi:hypothetical protein
LFAPVDAVPDGDLETIALQARSPAAEAAIKLNVFQMDSEEVAVASTHIEEVEEAVNEPKKRESKAPAADEKDVSEVVKKWTKK